MELTEEIIKKQTGFYKYVPKEYQDKVYRLAYMNGHAYGLNEVKSHLIDLIDIFKNDRAI